MCKRLEVEFEFGTKSNGISGRFTGWKQYDITRYEDVEALLTDVIKALKNNEPTATFSTYDSNYFDNLPAYGRITNPLNENFATCITWKNNEVKDKYQIDLCKKGIKSFVAQMIDIHRDDLAKENE